MEYTNYRFNGTIVIKFAPKVYKRFHLYIDHIQATGVKRTIEKIKEYVELNHIIQDETYEYIFVPEEGIEPRPTNIKSYYKKKI